MNTPVAVPPAAARPNVDAGELARFSALAHHWWDPDSVFGTLHQLNPLRLAWIEAATGGLAGKRVVDVGCGGGILSEAMAGRGAAVLGIDLADKPLGVARLHKLESGAVVDYRLVAAEALAAEAPGQFDVVTCMEMLEHVPDPASTIAACAALVKPGGTVVLSTINRNPKSYLFAVVGAEYVLGLLPRGTHDYAKFVRPAEVSAWARRCGLAVAALEGFAYNPLARTFRLSADISVNYLVALRRARDG
ncbi:MAG: bifunctional 2-polyprenyl-6-hydroxyphenol methylase/3-demethylubiquinol 3-O-methyltransferase UbiG [Betaproteobacteria bacterium]|nr:bifunctional 2-polyprenyl-6-hydroxyphenol methylase/3-demethylubiquinol 3-O-methyltransferase UbiG [Betaproteobacteria bacterium]